MFKTVGNTAGKTKVKVRTAGLWLLLVLLLSACQPIQRLPETKAAVAASAQTPLEQANQAVIQRFYEEVINQKKLEVFKEIFDPNVVDHQLGYGPAIGDPAREGFLPDLQIKVDLWVIEGDLLSAAVTVTGTHKGELLGVPATGKTVTWSHIDIWRVKNGKIVEVWHNFPTADILQQIGFTLVPPAK
jgi:predicted ester cyclase